ncbi:MAG: ABC transporter ATP-binding protein [Pseudomonadota bacterium]
MADPVLQIQEVSKSYGGLRATDAVSLDLLPGEIHALIGPNGAGKSTLIGQVAGMIAPDAGRVLIEGADVTGLSVAARARRGLGRTFQVSSLTMDLSALGNVLVPALAVAGSPFGFWRPVRRDRVLRQTAMAALARVGLEARADVSVGQLSHGERRQVEVACALALRPKLLLLDEPMAGLGAEGTAAMTELLAGLAHEVPILLVEHDMDAVFRLANRISVLVYGRILASGSLDDVRHNPAVREAYLGDDA